MQNPLSAQIPYWRALVSITFTFDGSGGNVTGTSEFIRVGDMVTMTLGLYRAATGTSSVNFSAPAGSIPPWARPAGTMVWLCLYMRNNAAADTANAGWINIDADGSILIRRNAAFTAWSNAANGGLQSRAALSWSIGNIT